MNVGKCPSFVDFMRSIFPKPFLSMGSVDRSLLSPMGKVKWNATPSGEFGLGQTLREVFASRPIQTSHGIKLNADPIQNRRSQVR